MKYCEKVWLNFCKKAGEQKLSSFFMIAIFGIIKK